MAKHKHNKPHGEPDEPDDDTIADLSAFDAAIPAPDEPVPPFPHAAQSAAIPPANPVGNAGAALPAPHGASPNPAAGAVPPVPVKAVPMKKATVTMPGAEPVEVEYPADTPEANRHAAAKGAYMAAVGQWALPAEPHIELH